jgi:acetylornithine deacetylase/succinyl-diaminopimelate desuccinylase-like protein
VKLDFVCKLLALERVRRERLRRTVLLVGTYGEETGRYGAKLLAGSRRPLPGMALVGEPSRLRPCAAHKGYVELHLSATADATPAHAAADCWRLTFEGTAAHSSQPHKGRSANDAALDALRWMSSDPGFRLHSLVGGDLVNRVATRAVAVVSLARRPSLETGTVEALDGAPSPPAPPELVDLLLAAHASTRWLEKELQRFPARGFDPPWSTVNNGLVRVVSGRLEHVCDVRRLNGEGPLRALDEHAARLEAAVDSWEGAARLERILDSPPFATQPGSVTLAALESTLTDRGLPTEHELKSGTTEASVYAEASIDTVVFGPGTASGNIHRPNERVPIADLEAAIAIYADVIRRLCA